MARRAGADVRVTFSADTSELRKQLERAFSKEVKAQVGVATKALRNMDRTIERGTKTVNKHRKSVSKLQDAMGGLANAGRIFLGLGLYRAFGFGTRVIREALAAQVEFNQALAEANSLISGSEATTVNIEVSPTGPTTICAFSLKLNGLPTCRLSASCSGTPRRPLT